MINLRVTGAFMTLLAMVACNSAGQAQASRQYRMRILDAETGRPIPGAVINLYYFPGTPDSPDADHASATTNDQGEAFIKSKAELAIWQVLSVGYIEQRLSGNGSAPPQRYAAHAKGNIDGMIYLYQLPEPQLQIAIPDGYTGLLTIVFHPAPGFDWVKIDPMNVAFAAIDPQASYVQESRGKRIFNQAASEGGVVDLFVTPLLYDLTVKQIQVEDGSGAIPFRDIATAPDHQRGVWGSVSEDEKQLHHQIRLFVGTQDDFLKSTNSSH